LGLGATALAALVLSGCGGGSAASRASKPSAEVARVGTLTITSSEFDHWLGVAVTGLNGGDAHGVLPTPIPPDYTACVNNLRALVLAARPRPRRQRPASALKAACARQYHLVAPSVLDFLIGADWTVAEARQLGIAVSAAEVSRAVALFKEKRAATPAGYGEYLARTGETEADVQARVRVRLLARAIRAKTAGETLAVRKQQRDRLRSVTVCAPGFTAPDCGK
jgi:hypothetical protein